MYHKMIFGSMFFKVRLFFQTETLMESATVWMTAISPHHSKVKMENGVVDMEKKIAWLTNIILKELILTNLISTSWISNMLKLLHVQEKLYHYLSSAMMVMIQHQYAIMFIQIHLEIFGQLKNLTWMFARITCKYRPAQF